MDKETIQKIQSLFLRKKLQLQVLPLFFVKGEALTLTEADGIHAIHWQPGCQGSPRSAKQTEKDRDWKAVTLLSLLPSPHNTAILILSFRPRTPFFLYHGRGMLLIFPSFLLLAGSETGTECDAGAGEPQRQPGKTNERKICLIRRRKNFFHSLAFKYPPPSSSFFTAHEQFMCPRTYPPT